MKLRRRWKEWGKRRWAHFKVLRAELQQLAACGLFCSCFDRSVGGERCCARRVVVFSARGAYGAPLPLATGKLRGTNVPGAYGLEGRPVGVCAASQAGRICAGLKSCWRRIREREEAARILCGRSWLKPGGTSCRRAGTSKSLFRTTEIRRLEWHTACRQDAGAPEKR